MRTIFTLFLLALLPLAVCSASDDDVEALLRQAAADDTKIAKAAASGITGYAQVELARTFGGKDHWSKQLLRAEIAKTGRIEGTGLKYKLSARLDYDAVYDATDFYPPPVERDQRHNLVLRENYLDFGIGDWEFRLGRQQIVWGEMVGLFFADVVSAREMREFILPEFAILRIPQWAARAEYFSGDFKGELLWIPVPSYDETGKPGSEFFPAQPDFGLPVEYQREQYPKRRLNKGNYGLRATYLTGGWDLSAFFYRSQDAAPTFYRQLLPGRIVYEARHDRITQWGGTLAKDFGGWVLKAEAVYTEGRRQTVLRLTDADGVVPQNTFDWIVGIEYPLSEEGRFNLQLFQSIITRRDPDVIPDRYESGYSLLLNRKLSPRWEGELLWIASLNRNDWLFRPRLAWSFAKDWRLTVGADVFHGPPLGLFGRHADRDRLYSELRYSF